MKLLLLAFLFFPLNVFAQKIDPRKIIITLEDTINIYQKVKYALVNNDFIIKDNGNKDTITTYVREYNGLYCFAIAVIQSNTVTLQGWYGLKRIDDFGYTQAPKNYKPISSFGGRGKTWRLLMNVAKKLGNGISYSTSIMNTAANKRFSAMPADILQLQLLFSYQLSFRLAVRC